MVGPFFSFIFISILSLSLPGFSQTNLEVANTMDINPIVKMKTNQGDITIKLKTETAPKACENFVKLAKKGYFNGITFHRVIQGFMIQSGDPEGNGTGGSSIWEHEFEDEFDVSIRFDKPGLLAMANRGPNTNGSQFFITTISTPWLDMKHTIFGEVIEGLDVVKRIETTPTNANDKPIEEQTIVSLEVVSRSLASN